MTCITAQNYFISGADCCTRVWTNRVLLLFLLFTFTILYRYNHGPRACCWINYNYYYNYVYQNCTIHLLNHTFVTFLMHADNFLTHQTDRDGCTWRKKRMRQTSNEQPNAAGISNHLLKIVTFGLQIGCVSVEYVGVLWVNVDVFEQVIPHEWVITFRVVSWYACNTQ